MSGPVDVPGKQLRAFVERIDEQESLLDLYMQAIKGASSVAKAA